MIIVNLTGGLGNQMFQYAAARCLAEKHSTILKLDINGFETYKLHRYSLHCFNIWEYLATQTEIEKIVPNNVIKALFKKNNFKEKHFHFDPAILEISNNSYLEGYWQSEKYFKDIKEILYREFSIKYPQDIKSHEINKLIKNSESVSIHIRRTDYINNEITHSVHGICGLDYYHNCIKLLLTTVTNPHFFVFSDDHPWVRENLKLDYPMTFVDHNDPSRNYEDLRLMSQCKHNIIANSTFSWWGAWLNQNPNKLVYAPKKWFSDLSRDTKDLIPKTWTII